MQVSKITTKFGVIKNHSEIEINKILCNSNKPNTFIEKNVKISCTQKEELKNTSYIIEKNKTLNIEKELLRYRMRRLFHFLNKQG